MQIKELTIAEDRKPESISAISLHALKDEFFRRMEGKAKNTLDEYRRSIIRLYDFMNNNEMGTIENLTEENIRQFQLNLFSMGNSQTTVHYHIKALRRFCDYLMTWGVLKLNPFKYCDIIPTPERITRSKRYYSHEESLRRYCNYLKKHYGYRVSRCYLDNLRAFTLYLEERDIKSITSVKYEDLAGYAEYIWNYRTPNGKNYTHSTIRDKLEGVKRFYRIFFREELIDKNPSKRLNIPAFLRSKFPDTRPRQVLIEKNDTFFDKLALQFNTYITTRGFAERTIKKYIRELKIFFEWLEKQEIKEPKEVTKHIIMGYYKELHDYKGVEGGGWSAASRHNHLLIVRKFFQFLTRFDYIEKDPTEYVELPKKETGLPTNLLKDSEATRILESTDSSKELAARDKAIIELLYSTAIRSDELCHIEIGDLDFEARQIIIRKPKGGKSYQRVVPFGSFADKALRDYIENLRPRLANGASKALFLSRKGNMLNNHSLCDLIKEYVRLAGIKSKITTHSFRVGCATEMLRNGADVRYVQTLLGHKRIETTQIYTRLDIGDLKRVHRRYHPREKYYRKVKNIGRISPCC
ncbi:MAG: tyrosine-type recombinase/integrase [Candidatus Omnitrophica bacterium]|nr:tyrosine-type recombinase/integrase [Candidatus Omnitrophota bacterium]